MCIHYIYIYTRTKHFIKHLDLLYIFYFVVSNTSCAMRLYDDDGDDNNSNNNNNKKIKFVNSKLVTRSFYEHENVCKWKRETSYFMTRVVL